MKINGEQVAQYFVGPAILFTAIPYLPYLFFWVLDYDDHYDWYDYLIPGLSLESALMIRVPLPRT